MRNIGGESDIQRGDKYAMSYICEVKQDEKEEGYYFDHRNFAFSDNFFYENKWGI